LYGSVTQTQSENGTAWICGSIKRGDF
jgi:hypothetical protein